jgi:hypothetical protein
LNSTLTNAPLFYDIILSRLCHLGKISSSISNLEDKIMTLHNTESLFDELSRAEITFRPGPPVRELSLLDLGDKGTEFLFNGAPSVAAYRSRLLKLHAQFKEELLEWAEKDVKHQHEMLRHLKTRIKELRLILHPINEEVLFTHVCFPKYSNRIQPSTDLDLFKKKYFFT